MPTRARGQRADAADQHGAGRTDRGHEPRLGKARFADWRPVAAGERAGIPPIAVDPAKIKAVMDADKT